MHLPPMRMCLGKLLHPELQSLQSLHSLKCYCAGAAARPSVKYQCQGWLPYKALPSARRLKRRKFLKGGTAT